MLVQYVSDFFVYASQLCKTEEVTVARLNALLYLAQGWHLFQYNVPLFEDDFEAKRNGPIVIFSDDDDIFKISEDFGIEKIDNAIFEFLLDVFANYCDVPTESLLAIICKKGSPWIETYSNGIRSMIPKEAIRKAFSSMPKLETIDDAIRNIPVIGRINEEGITVLPSEYKD